ncbi:hypothetical protein GCM10029963_24040 [Micromonospora andamanensis]
MSLTLRGAAALVRPDDLPYEPDEALLAYHRDLLAPYGIEVDEDLMKQSRNIGFRELAEELMDRCPSPFGPPDLLILAYGLPDRYPLKTVTTRLNALFGGRSHSFAVSEQGLQAPFTALRVADAYTRSGKKASLALFVCEQTTLPYRDPLVHDTPCWTAASCSTSTPTPDPVSASPQAGRRARTYRWVTCWPATLRRCRRGRRYWSPARGQRTISSAASICRCTAASPAATAQASGWTWPVTTSNGPPATPTSSSVTPIRGPDAANSPY